jgi:hypothetical protein
VQTGTCAPHTLSSNLTSCCRARDQRKLQTAWTLRRYRLRTLIAIIASLTALAVGVNVAAASQAQPSSGLLVGLTQISYGCPGPARVGYPSCESWHPFPHGRFAIRQIGPNRHPLPQIIRVIVSDRQGRLSIRLSTGDYQVTPLAQAHTSGGRKLTVRIRSDHTTRILIRSLGIPRMV